VDAAWLAVAGWPDAWSDAGRWRCPPLRRRRPDRVRTHRLGGHIELGCPADRTLERSAMSATRPATAGCPQEELIGGAGLSRRVSGGRTLAERAASLTAAMSGTPWRVLEVPTGRFRVRRRPTSDSGAGSLLVPPIGPTDECGGGWVSGYRQATLSVGAGGPAGGSARRRVVPGGADRLAAGESLGTSCSGSACIKNSKDTSR
jgi:hypothetical protein